MKLIGCSIQKLHYLKNKNKIEVISPLKNLLCMCNNYSVVPYSIIPCSGFYRVPGGRGVFKPWPWDEPRLEFGGGEENPHWVY